MANKTLVTIVEDVDKIDVKGAKEMPLEEFDETILYDLRIRMNGATESNCYWQELTLQELRNVLSSPHYQSGRFYAAKVRGSL